MFILFASKGAFAVTGDEHVVEKVVITWHDTLRLNFVSDPVLYSEGWDTLPQALFWKDVICMSSDSCIVNVAHCRQPIERVSRNAWMDQSEEAKSRYKDSVCSASCYNPGTSIFVTSGKAEFYELKKVLPDISKAIKVFRQNNCDPFYAQAILLIESPGKNKSKSYVGANGPFQLMRSVAKKYGLRVTKNRDDRTDLEKSAKVAAKLLNAGCVAYVKQYLDERSISYRETDLWFRLLVLHAYHAGAGSVRCVINQLNPDKGGVDLFRQIWQTECGLFKNESQNYSQIALASLVSFDEIINRDGGDTVYLVRGDKMMKHFNRKIYRSVNGYDYLNTCLVAYEADLVDGTIPFDPFMKRVGVIRKELLHIATKISGVDERISINQFPASEEHVDSLAMSLLKHQRFEEAIKLLKLNIDMHPSSIAAYDSLARAYSASGNKQLALIYSNRSVALGRNQESRNRIQE